MQKKIKKLELHRETLLLLRDGNLRDAKGGIVLNTDGFLCNDTYSHAPCSKICP
jgi:hypothetical protein